MISVNRATDFVYDPETKEPTTEKGAFYTGELTLQSVKAVALLEDLDSSQTVKDVQDDIFSYLYGGIEKQLKGALSMNKVEMRVAIQEILEALDKAG